MIKNHLKTAFRQIRKNKLITAINILSLAIGICATLIIFLIVRYDYSFDRHLPHGDRVFRVVSNGDVKNAGIPVPFMYAIEEEISGLEAVAPILQIFSTPIKIEKDPSGDPQEFKQEIGFVITNESYFKIYPHQWLAGNEQNLTHPNQVVLTEEYFKRYFPDTPLSESVGKVISFSEDIPLEVAGVVAEMKENSDFKYQAFVSLPTITSNVKLKESYAIEQWSSYSDSFQCLVLLETGASTSTIKKNIDQLIVKHKKPKPGAWKDKFTLQPIQDVHFNSDFNWMAVNPVTLRNLILLALFLLTLGAINFINLSSAQSIERAKEIGVRKTLGSSKTNLIYQFLIETFLIAGAATLISILLLPTLLNVFKEFLPQGFSLDYIPWTPITGFLTIQLVVVTLLAGFYPAWIMTGYSPVLALKNQISKNSRLSRSAWVRKALTIFQFTLAQCFLIAVLLISKQINFMTNMDMGFRKDAIIFFFIPDFNEENKSEILKNKLSEIPEIKTISLGNHSPAISGGMSTTIPYIDKSGAEQRITLDSRDGDENYIKIYDIPLKAGRNIRLTDSIQEVLINEKALQAMGFESPKEAIDQTFSSGSYTIVGIMKDFNVASAHHEIRPTLYIGKKNGYVMHISLDQAHPASWKTVIEKTEKEFKEIYPDKTFDYRFVDEEIENLYQKEQKLSKLMNWAVGLSITIASLGLFGLAIFTAHQRTKEIGIRKVLGASVVRVIILLVRDIVFLVLLACLIAIPLAWFFMNKWLEDFVYKTSLTWDIFAVAAIGLLTVATLVLSVRTYYAARANPVDSLRNE